MASNSEEVLAERLTPAQRAIIEQEYPHFSDAEMDRRRELIGRWLDEHELDHILVYGAYWAGNGVGFFTGWPVTAEAAVVFSPDATPAMYVQFYNHVPEATHIAYQAEVGPGGESTIGTAIATMEQRGKANPRVGVIGPLPMGAYRALEARTSDIVDLNRAYFGARMIKSEEEFDWLKIGAVLSDLSYEALLHQLEDRAFVRELRLARLTHDWNGLVEDLAPDHDAWLQAGERLTVGRLDVVELDGGSHLGASQQGVVQGDPEVGARSDGLTVLVEAALVGEAGAERDLAGSRSTDGRQDGGEHAPPEQAAELVG